MTIVKNIRNYVFILMSDGRTGAKSGEVFCGRTVGWRLLGRTVGRRTDGSFYFALEPPPFSHLFREPVLKENHVAGAKDNPAVAAIDVGVCCHSSCGVGVVDVVTAHSSHFVQFKF